MPASQSTLARIFVVLALSLLIFYAATDISASPLDHRAANTGRALENLAGIPLSFEANLGQTDSQARFISRGPGYTMFLTQEGVVISLQQPGTSEEPAATAIQMTLVGARGGLELSGLAKLPWSSNYLIGSNSSQWHRNISTYERVQYHEVWPGIDMMLYGNQRQLEYDFVIAPGADPSQIAWQIEGTEMALADNGDLTISLPQGELRQFAPIIYQEVAGKRHTIEGGFVVEGQQVSFQVGAYDPTLPLVIDPVLNYSTFLGGSDTEAVTHVTADSAGQTYIVGQTTSANFPTTPGAYDPTFGSYTDIYVAKLSDDGSTLLYCTYIGGVSVDIDANGAYVDEAGNLYIAGETQGSDFPTTSGAYDTSFNGASDAFVLKLNSTGSDLIFSTFVGGPDTDEAFGLAVDPAGNIYLTGQASDGFPTTAGAYDTNYNGGSDAFVTKLNSSGSALLYSTYLGSTAADVATGIAVNTDREVYLTGETSDQSFPTTPAAYDSSFNGSVDLFVTKLNASGSDLIYSTFLGSSGTDHSGLGMALNPAGEVYITGRTGSGYPTTAGAYDPSFNGGGSDVVVTRLNSSGSDLIFSTYLGGGSTDFGRTIALGQDGSVFLSGNTLSSFPTTVGAYDTSANGSTDAFLAELSADGTALLYSTYLGGSGTDNATGLFVRNGRVYVSGSTTSAGTFPVTAGAYDTTHNGGSTDAFVMRFDFNSPPTVSAIANQTLDEDGVAGPLDFTVGDNETAVGELTVAASSSNQALVPDANLVLGGSDANRTLLVTPAADQSGVATITLTISDGLETASTQFTLTVNAVNDSPTISHISDQESDEDEAVGPLAFAVGDIETFAADLTVSAASSNTDLLPPDHISLGGSGANRTVSLTPLTNQSGSAVITLTVSDGQASDQITFTLIVNPVNDAPGITAIADQEVNEDTPAGPISFTIDDVDTPAESLEVSALSDNTDLMPNGNITLAGTGAQRTITLDPAPNQSGLATLAVMISDGLLTASTQFSLTVQPINDVPTISGLINQEIDEDATLGPVNFMIGDVESPASDLLVSSSSSNQALVPDTHIAFGGSGANRTVTITPVANQSGVATITVTLDDGTDAVPDTFILTVQAVNDVPMLSALADQVTDEDVATGPIAFSIGDIETPAEELAVSTTSTNQALVPADQITLDSSGANRTISLTPAGNQNGQTMISISVSDGTDIVSKSFTLTVNAVNDKPMIDDIADQETDEDTPAGPFTFTIGDVETDADLLEVNATSSDSDLLPDGQLTLSGTGASRSIRLDPSPNQSGLAIITLTVSDGLLSSSTRFSLTVNAVNDLPTLSLIADQETDEDVAIGPIPFTLDDIETPADDLGVSGRSSNPVLVPESNIVFGGAGANRTLTVTPAANMSGAASITLTVDDGDGTAERSFNLTVHPVNDLPTLSEIANQIVNEDETAGPIPFVITDVETPASALIVSGSSSNPALVPDANLDFGGSGSNRTITASPMANQSGVATITITVADGTDVVSETFSLTVKAVNDPPHISPIADQVADEDTSVGPLSFTIDDVETPVELLQVSASSSNPDLLSDANITLAGSGPQRTIELDPLADQAGLTIVTLSVDDGTAAASTTFTLTVEAINDAPTISDIPAQEIEEDEIAGPLAFTIGDVDSSMDSLTVSAASSNPVLVPVDHIIFNGSGTDRLVTITPAANQFGSATITLTVADGSATPSTSFTLTVNPVNDLPQISNIADQLTDEDTATGPISFTVSDVETPAASLTLSTISSDPELIPGANISLGGSGLTRTVVITPASNRYGTAAMTLSVDDGTDVTSTTFTLTVKAINDLPTISALPDQVTAEDMATAPLSFSIGDVETPAAMLTVSGVSSNPGLVPDANITFNGNGANRTVTLSPAADQSGTATITLSVDDGTQTVSESFALTVQAVNDPPTLSALGDQVVNEDQATALLSLIINDVETPAGDLDLTAASSNPVLVPNDSIVLGGLGANRTVQITPALNQSGVATISLAVTDGTDITALSFTLTVNAVNDSPTLSQIADQTTLEDTPVGPVGFTIGDVESEADALVVSVEAADSELVPHTNIELGGSGPNRTLQLTPAADMAGMTIITITVTDGAATAAESFTLTVNPVNDAPTLSHLPDQEIEEDSSAGPINFTLADVETAAEFLEVSAVSSNPALLPETNITLSGAGSDRTISLVPAPNQYGTADITLTVSDGSLTGAASFVLTVNPVNDAPTIAAIADQETVEDVAVGPITFAIDDAEMPGYLLDVSAVSANPDLVSGSHLVIDGWGNSRTIRIAPLDDQSGAAVITVTVSDGLLTDSSSFTLTVYPVNDPPTISNLADQVTAYQTATDPISFTIADIETDSGLLELVATSANPELLPDDNIRLSGSGFSRAISLIPAPQQSGLATITITVSDGEAMNSTAFRLTVHTPDDDTDGDGLPDGWEVAHTFDPMVDDAAGDPDSDRLTNLQEYQAGTDPRDPDSDHDTIPDGLEGSGDADQDGLSNALDDDDDGDGLATRIECPAGIPCPDSDGDGLPDYLDPDSDGDGLPDAVEGSADPDGDGIPNRLDEDSDEDGLADSAEGDLDADGDGMPDYLDSAISLTLTGLSPLWAGQPQAVTLTVTGTGFLLPFQLKVGAETLADVTLINPKTLQGVIPAGILTPGLYDIHLTRSDGETASKEAAFLITTGGPPVPEITVINPISITDQLTGTLTVTGTGFLPLAQIGLVSAEPQPEKSSPIWINTTFVNPEKLQGLIPAGLLAPGLYDVKVINPEGLGEAILAAAFRVEPKAQGPKIYLPIVIK